jgi:hypothetical protein
MSALWDSLAIVPVGANGEFEISVIQVDANDLDKMNKCGNNEALRVRHMK